MLHLELAKEHPAGGRKAFEDKAAGEERIDRGLLRYHVSGDAACNSLLTRLAPPGAPVKLGCLSPLAPLRRELVPDAVTRHRLVPASARYFAFAYPIDLATEFDELLSDVVGSASGLDRSLFFFFALGGFAFFDRSEKFVGAVAFSLTPSSAVLDFDGPYQANTAAGHELGNRLQPLPITPLVAAGLRDVAWIHPNEQPGDYGAAGKRNVSSTPLCSDGHVSWQAGALLFRAVDEGGTCIFYSLRLSRMPTPALLRLASKAPSHPWTRWAVGCFSGAFESMHVSFEACEVERRQLGEDVARAARGRASQWARDFGLLLPAFLAIGIAAYRHYEGFSTFDTLYYITATVTTVGYGDFHPATQAGRLFTAVYAPFGVVVVMSGLLPLVHTLLEAIDGWTAALVWANERAVLAVVEQTRRLICGCAAPSSRVPQTVVLRGLDLRLERRVYIVGASAAYVHALLSPLLLFSLGVLLATVVQRYTLIDAIYWLSITMTTIGYGDLVPSTWVEKLYTMLLMLLASTAVAATVGKFEKLRTASRIHRTNFRVRLMELMHASAVKLNVSEPTIAEEAFVVRTLVDFGLVEEETIDEIRERFREISGRSSEDREQGVATINLRHLYANLVKQGRVLDANIVAANALGQRKRTANAAEADRRRKAADAAAQARARARQLLFSGASTIPATPAPIAVEEQTPARLSHNGVPAVDMSTGDHGYSEWLELVWIPSLPTTADASGAERPWVLPASLPVSDRARGRVEGATKPREGEGMRGVAPPSSGGIAAMLRKKSREASPMPRPAPLPAPQVRRGYTRLTDATSELDA